MSASVHPSVESSPPTIPDGGPFASQIPPRSRRTSLAPGYIVFRENAHPPRPEENRASELASVAARKAFDASSSSSKRGRDFVLIASGVLGTCIALAVVGATGGFDTIANWSSFHFGGGGAGRGGPAENLDLGGFTTDIRDAEGAVYTANISVTVELNDTVPDDDRKKLVATGRHAVLQGVRTLQFSSFDPENLPNARNVLTKRVTRELGEANVNRVLFTDLAFYLSEERPPIAPVVPMSQPPRPADQPRPMPAMPPFKSSGPAR